MFRPSPNSYKPSVEAAPCLQSCQTSSQTSATSCQSWLRPRGRRGRVLKEFQAEVELEKGGSIPRAAWQCQQSQQRCHTRSPALGLGTGMLTRGLKLPSSVFHTDPAARAREKQPGAGFGCSCTRTPRAAGQEGGAGSQLQELQPSRLWNGPDWILALLGSWHVPRKQRIQSFEVFIKIINLKTGKIKAIQTKKAELGWCHINREGVATGLVGRQMELLKTTTRSFLLFRKENNSEKEIC